jgi:hypothetical protein
VLAVIQIYHETYGRPPQELRSDTDVLVPAAILEICGAYIAGRSRYLKAVNEARRKTAKQSHRQYQIEAERIWKSKPGLSKAAVAKIIARPAPQRTAKADTIRRVIIRKK